MYAFINNKKSQTAWMLTVTIHVLLFLWFMSVVFIQPLNTFKEKRISKESGKPDGIVIDFSPGTKETTSNNEKNITDPQTTDAYANVSESLKPAVHPDLQKLLSKIRHAKNTGGISNKPGADGNEMIASETVSPVTGFERRLLQKPLQMTDSKEQGTVVVEITIDETGKVIRAIPGQRGSTTTSYSLFAKARQAAYEAKFSPSPEGIKEQRGTYTFVFTLE